MTRRRATIYLLITALLWSLGGLLIKSIDLHPLALSGLRSLFTAAFLLLAAGRGVLRRLLENRRPLHLAAGLAYAGVVILLVLATKMTTAANAILLQYTAPVFVALFSYGFLRERISTLDWLTILTVLGGLMLFFLGDLSPTGLWGNAVAILSGICYAWLALLLRRDNGGHPVDSLVLGNLLTALICLPFMLRASPSPGQWLGVVFLGVVQLGIPYLLYAAAIRHLRAVEMVLIPVIEPILNPVWVLLFLGERPAPWTVAGGAIVLAAITVRGLIVARAPGEAPAIPAASPVEARPEDSRAG